jgi:tRNA threonylcarbamoyladenosine biosynthesis protein TsaB
VLLAIDTCLNACSTAVMDGARVLAARSEPMERGHQERLAPLLAELMAEAGVAFADLDGVAVTVGPGSFTGLRVGLAFAKGLGLALERPVTGVGTLHAMAASVGEHGRVAAVIDARREQVYLQAFADGAALGEPEALSAGDAGGRLNESGGSWRLVGSGAGLLLPMLDGATVDDRAAPDPVAVARLALRAPGGPANPVYLRAPDAKLPS